MSYSRLPLAMAQDGMLPGVFGKLQKKSRAPWVAIVALAIGWAMCLGLGFARLVTLDILLYGSACCWSSWRWPCCASANRSCRALPRSRRIVRSDRDRHCTHAVAGFSIIRSEHEQIWNMSSFAFGMILIAAGFVAYASIIC
jgi:hypothetical protein